MNKFTGNLKFETGEIKVEPHNENLGTMKITGIGVKNK